MKDEEIQFRAKSEVKAKLDLVSRITGIDNYSAVLRGLIEEAYQKLPEHIKAEFEKGLSNGK